ncbi:MAG: DUF4416 family protein, partial [Syntrophales bacterium]|nr:DUF4416 family protein [Syntrophales bacterium]
GNSERPGTEEVPMSSLRQPLPVKLVMSILTPTPGLIGEVLASMTARWGMLDYISPVMPFPYTDYYEAEMGKGIVRRFVSFGDLMAPEMLPHIKEETNTLEKQWSVERGRRVNIDPGYISAAQLILATGKGFAHRPYLGQGVYADLTLIYKDGAFQPLPWTYPDYRSEGMRSILTGIRRKYLEQLRIKHL